MEYKEQIKDGRWQRKRLEIMQRDDFKCNICNEVNKLHVHHLYYKPNAKIWEYDNETLVTVCDNCHELLHKELGKISGLIAFKMLRSNIDILELYDVDNLEWLSENIKSKEIERIRKKITINGEKLRFDMSGYYNNKKGDIVVMNDNILKIFADEGIYDYTTFLYLDFYKGLPQLYLQYWNEKIVRKYEFCGYTTTEIIFEILVLTIYSGKSERRRY